VGLGSGRRGVAHPGIAGRISERPRARTQPARATPHQAAICAGPGNPVLGRSEPRYTQDDTRRPGQAGTGPAQARRPARPEPAATVQTTPADRPAPPRRLSLHSAPAPPPAAPPR